MNEENYIGKFVGADVYMNGNELRFKFINKGEAHTFLGLVAGSISIGPQPSVADLMIWYRKKNINETN